MKLKCMFFLIILAMVVFGCEVSTSKDPNHGGSINLLIASLVNSRTIEPPVEMVIKYYNISCIGANGDKREVNGVTANNVSLTELGVGKWTVNVSAFNKDNIEIAFGTTEVTIVENETVSTTVTVTPLKGNGTLKLTLLWPEGSVSNPSLDATLTPAGTTTLQPTIFNIDGSTANYEKEAAAGYYTFHVFLKNNDNEVGGTATAVRILAGHTTEAIIEIDVGGTGDIIITIKYDLQNPIGISFAGFRDTLAVGTNMTITATTSEAVNTYQWYLNGEAQTGATTKTFTIGSALAKRKHRLDLMVTKGNIVSSKSVDFSVITPPAEAAISLLHFDGLNGGPITDLSGKKWVVTGSAAISDAVTKNEFGQSLYLSGLTYARTAFSPDFDFKGNDFTIDWWEYRISAADSMQALQFSYTGSSNGSMLVGLSSGGYVYFYAGTSSGNWNIASPASMGTVKVNQWVHRAVVRNDNKFYTFENGQLISTWSSSIPLSSNCDYVSIGSCYYSYAENMYIDELRISNVARWTSAFTPLNQPY